MEPLYSMFGSRTWGWSRSIERIFAPDAGWLGSTKSIEPSHPTLTALLSTDGDWRWNSGGTWCEGQGTGGGELGARTALGVEELLSGGELDVRGGAPAAAELGVKVEWAQLRANAELQRQPSSG